MGELDRALVHLQACLAWYGDLGSALIRREALPELAWALLAVGDLPQAQRYFAQALTVFRRAGMRRHVAWCLEGMASAAAQSVPHAAPRLWGAAAALRDRLGAPMWPVDRPEYEQRVAACRVALGDAAFDAAWAAGQALTWEQAVDAALAALGSTAS